MVDYDIIQYRQDRPSCKHCRHGKAIDIGQADWQLSSYYFLCEVKNKKIIKEKLGCYNRYSSKKEILNTFPVKRLRLCKYFAVNLEEQI